MMVQPVTDPELLNDIICQCEDDRDNNCNCKSPCLWVMACDYGGRNYAVTIEGAYPPTCTVNNENEEQGHEIVLNRILSLWYSTMLTLWNRYLDNNSDGHTGDYVLWHTFNLSTLMINVLRAHTWKSLIAVCIKMHVLLHVFHLQMDDEDWWIWL